MLLRHLAAQHLGLVLAHALDDDHVRRQRLRQHARLVLRGGVLVGDAVGADHLGRDVRVERDGHHHVGAVAVDGLQLLQLLGHALLGHELDDRADVDAAVLAAVEAVALEGGRHAIEPLRDGARGAPEQLGGLTRGQDLLALLHFTPLSEDAFRPKTGPITSSRGKDSDSFLWSYSIIPAEVI
mgnify:CR=1 FL=1